VCGISLARPEFTTFITHPVVSDFLETLWLPIRQNLAMPSNAAS
jgi:hypothetical protein